MITETPLSLSQIRSFLLVNLAKPRNTSPTQQPVQRKVNGPRFSKPQAVSQSFLIE
jgi:hypothetical protein